MPEKETYLRSLKVICPDLTDEGLAYLPSRINVQELKKKAFFLEAGEVQTALGFITQGLVRSFYVDGDGNERTVGFYAEGEYATHYPSFISRQPSRYSIQCLEPTTFVCLSFEELQAVYQKFPVLEHYGRLIAEDVVKRQQARIESFLFQTAEERYVDFMKEQKSLFNRVSLSHLCSYLGIERQSLTRIRQKLAHK